MKKFFFVILTGFFSFALSSSVAAQDRPDITTDHPQPKKEVNATEKPAMEVRKIEVPRTAKPTNKSQSTVKEKNKVNREKPVVKVGEQNRQQQDKPASKKRPKIDAPQTEKSAAPDNTK
jgi:hypothetical protein